MGKLLSNRTSRPPSTADVAAAVVNAAQLVLRLLRAEVRRQHPVNLSVTQLRALDYLSANPDTSLSAVADYVGLTLPSASVLIDGLARRRLVGRRAAPRDRRRLRLRVTAAGQGALRKTLDAARAALADRLGALAPRDRALVARAMAHISAAAAPRGHAAATHGR
jgi:DNA-binding MarR family transcriptional regulator